MTCPHCEKLLKPTANFCTGCGNPIQQPYSYPAQTSYAGKTRCECGTQVDPAAAFCSVCGRAAARSAYHAPVQMMPDFVQHQDVNLEQKRLQRNVRIGFGLVILGGSVGMLAYIVYGMWYHGPDADALNEPTLTIFALTAVLAIGIVGLLTAPYIFCGPVQRWKRVVASVVAVHFSLSLVLGLGAFILVLDDDIFRQPRYVEIQGERFSTDRTWLRLDARGLSDEDIITLQYMVNLEWLNLAYNNITDLQPLSGLVSLEWLNLNNNNIANLRPLSGLVNLEQLGLAANNISNLYSLSGLVNLEVLELSINNITDLQPLSGLVSLEELGLSNNNITDLQPLSGLVNLERLGLRYNNITNLQPLSGLVNLETLRVSLETYISDYSSVAHVPYVYH